MTRTKPIYKTTADLTGAYSRLKEQCEDRPAFERVERLEERYAELRREHEMALLRLEGSLADGNVEFIKEMAIKTLSEVGRQDLPNFGGCREEQRLIDEMDEREAHRINRQMDSNRRKQERKDYNASL